jgi:hypothetical protein
MLNYQITIIGNIINNDFIDKYSIFNSIKFIILQEHNNSYVEKCNFTDGYIIDDLFEYNFTIKKYMIDKNNSKLNIFLEKLKKKILIMNEKFIYNIEININK